ncbi:MAG TPA: GAF domain-containing sensor histidine kinase [Longimicrobiaceae bacterium]|nr:GAF domain-containing sensor histidine kinase [Longimicrobiaceae bacterium]
MADQAPSSALLAPARVPTAGLPGGADALEALRRIAVDALDTVDPDEVFRIVCAHLPEVLGADFAAVQLPLLEGTREWCARQAPPDGARSVLEAALERARRAGETFAVGGVGEGPPPDRRLEGVAGLSAVAAPLLREGAAWGVLLVGWHRREPPIRDAVRVAEVVAQEAAAAFRNAARYDALRQAAVRRERFFSAMSHDLRTPITAIVGYSELLADGIVGELGERQQEMVERISQVSGHLSQLVNDILDLAKLDAGRMEFHRESVQLGELVEEAILAVEPQARSKGLELRREVAAQRGTVLEVDAPRVRQILVNLLSNAVKFTERGAVAVTAGAGEGRSWIEVADTGPGIPAGSEEAVFEEFLQIAAGTKAKREPGTGLGLAISRRLARAMGGDLTARNAGGAVFTLFLPLEPGSAGPAD